MSSEEKMTLRLVYIHGFQGDHTSFQSFPTDLHAALASRLPPQITLESCLYPTYKSVRPISVATSNLLAWLRSQPPGPVILLAHSMGGLLAAEAATMRTSPEAKRIVGLVAFDVPYLGMHPHVVISGIASLFNGDSDEDEEKDKNKNGKKHKDKLKEGLNADMPEVGRDVKTEKELNDDTVKFVDQRVVDDWSLYGETLGVPGDGSSPYGHPSSAPASRSPSPGGSQLSLDWESYKASFNGHCSSQTSVTRSPSPSPSPTRLDSARPTLPSASSLTSYISALPSSSRLPNVPKTYQNTFQSALSTVTALIPPSYASSPTSTPSRFLRWLNKHSDDPLRAVVRWVVERLEFGICMFDPQGLVERYRALERWEGMWVNYWTETGREGADTAKEKKAKEDPPRHFIVLPSSSGLSFVGFNSNPRSASSKRSQANPHHNPTSHTVRLQPSTTSNWELVRIPGAEDEVQAHCGLFIRKLNKDYEALVERVASRVEDWVAHRVLGGSSAGSH